MGDAQKDDQRYTLEELGIVKANNPFGEEQLTIDLPPNEILGLAQGRVVFDQTSKTWHLTATSGLKLDRSSDAVWKRKLPSTELTDISIRPIPWTRALPTTDFVDTFLNTVDWANTPLGPLETWSTTLQTYLNIVFADSQYAVIYWGEQLCALYNTEMIRLVTDRLNKPQDLLGVPFTTMWPELWDDFEPMFKSIAARGTGLETLEVCLFPMHNGRPEESFFQGSFLPIRDSDGQIRGFYNRAREITKTVIYERRSKVLGAIAAKPHIAGNFIFKHVISSLCLAERDFPFAFVYSADEDVAAGKCRLTFQCGEGLPGEGNPLVPSEMELYEGHTGYTPFFRKAKSRDKALVLHDADGSLPKQLLQGFEWNGFGDPPHSIAILPLSTSDRLLAILVFGLNPRRPYDTEYENYVNTLTRSISATVASAIDREEARNRAERLGKQLEDSEKSIRELAEYGPVGIARLAPSGKLMWANDQWYGITGHSREGEDQYEMSFIDFVHPDDKQQAISLWQNMAESRGNVSTAVRLSRTWTPPQHPDMPEETMPTWVLASGYPILEGGEIKAYASSVTDISRFKWAEMVQSRSAEAAKEAKRLQENFIDIVSHEMRNPLSAITQLSDGISTSLEEFEATDHQEEDARNLLKSNVDSANTILLCAAHQKRIIDDVLTLSKLDAMMLSITPVIVQPRKVVESVLRMFEAEFEANEIEVDSETSPSYAKHEVDWVTLDPSRLTQIFINLITNAIKFTKLEASRKITIRVGAQDTRPPSVADVSWFPTNKKYKDLTVGPEWGNGKSVFICFEVQDTGRGLEQSEMNKLFERFQQATEKTHIKYGGSGLGLFISRELTETQGGEIGVRSERGKGTTFAFYVKGKRAEAPDDPAQILQPPATNRSAREQSRRAQQQRAAAQSNEEAIGKKLCVLLVEDNIVNAKVLIKQLERANCEVHLAKHGMEALDFLKKMKAWKGNQNKERAIDIDVCLMDVEMPIMDGLTCTRQIRQLEGEGQLTHHVNILAITANARQEQIDTVIQAGADGVLPKPFRVKDCLENMRMVVARNQQEQMSKQPQEG